MNENVKEYRSADGQMFYVSFWKAGDHYRLQTNDPNVVERIRTWRFANITGYGINTYLRIFTIPREKASWVRKEMGFSRPNRTAKQQAVTELLNKKGEPSRFGCQRSPESARSGQDFHTEARSGHKNLRGIPTPYQTMIGSQTGAVIQKGDFRYEVRDR